MSQEPKPIKVLRQEEPKQPLRNMLELIKVMRAHRRGTGAMPGESHSEPSAQTQENEKTRTAECSGKGNKRLGEILFPRLLGGREKSPPSASEETSEIPSKTPREDEHFFMENGYCLQHSRFCSRWE